MNSFNLNKKKVDCLLKNNIDLVRSDKFRECLNYSIIGGKRLRPIIILEMCKTFNVDSDCCEKLVLLVEYLHCASLILDDLPSMDNDELRRGLPTFHKKYGVKSAYIIANYMINKSLVSLMTIVTTKSNLYDSDLLTKLASIVFTNNNLTSIGQMVDLSGYQNTDNSKYQQIIDLILSNNLILDISNKCFNSNKILMEKVVLLNLKTFPLFYLSFQLPYLLSKNKDLHISLEMIQYLAFIFSLSFQIADDFEDVEKDSTSFILLLGREKARDIYTYCEAEFKKNIKELNNSLFSYVFNILNKKIQ